MKPAPKSISTHPFAANASTLFGSSCSARSRKASAGFRYSAVDPRLIRALARKYRSIESGSGDPLGAPRLRLDQLRAQLAGEPSNNVVLHLEQIGQFLVETLGPEMRAGVAIDQLYVNAHAVAPALHPPLQRVAHVQVAADLPEI